MTKKAQSFRTILLAGSALAFASPAFAQTAPASGAPVSNAAQASIADIVVTATRRAERLQDVPIAISALDGAQVQAQRIDNFASITKIAPGPTFVPVKGTSTIAVQIRGKYSNNDAPGLENPVGVYIDDIYYGSLASFDANLFDVSQIAILRGPQGTTFGRNAVGGALQITNNVAELGKTDARITLTGLGNAMGQLGIESDGYVNYAIGSSLAARFAYSVKNDGGYQKNLLSGNYLDDNRVQSVRGSVTWQASERLKMTASASYTHRGGYGDGAVIVGQGALVKQVRAANGGDLHKTLLDDDGETRRHLFAGILKLEYDTDVGTIASITGYRSLNAFYQEDSDGGPLPANYPSININKEKQVSEELRFTSKFGGPFDFVSGVYFGYEDLYKGIQFNFNGTLPQSYLSVLSPGRVASQFVAGRIYNYSVGPFIEGKYKITPQLSLTAGLRYSYERKNGYTSHEGSSPFYGAPYFVELGKNGGTNSWQSFTPRFIVDYKPTRDISFYASVSKGFQGGGWVLTATSAAKALVPLAAETTWSYEIGTKSNFFNHFLTTNVAAYLSDTSNLQVRSLINGVLTDSNAGKERVKGVEVEAAIHPVAGLSIGANYAYTDAVYRSFPGCAAGGLDCTGNRVPFVSKNDFTALLDYKMDLKSGARLGFHFDDKFASPYQLIATNLQQIGVPYTRRRNVANASVSYTPPSGAWDLRLWSTNLFDKTYASNGLNYYFYHMSPAEVSAGGGAANADVERLTIAPPRVIGITFTARVGG